MFAYGNYVSAGRRSINPYGNNVNAGSSSILAGSYIIIAGATTILAGDKTILAGTKIYSRTGSFIILDQCTHPAAVNY